MTNTHLTQRETYMHTRLIGHKVFKPLSVIFKKKLRYKITGRGHVCKVFFNKVTF